MAAVQNKMSDTEQEAFGYAEAPSSVYPASRGFLVALCSGGLLIRPPEHRATKKPLLAG